MKYRVVVPKKGNVEFDTYTGMLFALRQFRNHMDHITAEEIDENGNVHAVINNAELRKIILDMDALGASSVPYAEPKDT